MIVDHNRYQESSEERPMEKSELKTFTTADEVREFPQGRVELLNAGGVRVGRVTVEPRLEMDYIDRTSRRYSDLRCAALLLPPAS
jgi:hypothetical protein